MTRIPKMELLGEKEANKGKWYFLQSPVVISLLSNLIFAIIVGIVLAYIQHGNWKEQENISRKNRRTDLIFEKRAEILEKYTNVFMMRTQNIWNIRNLYDSLDKINEKSEFVRVSDALAKCGLLDQELISKMMGIETLEACYFRTSDMPKTLKKLRDRLHDIVFNFNNEETSLDERRKSRSIKVVNEEMKQCDRLNDIIISRMLNVIYVE